ncbi:MAG TPA: SDR family oxidoreductase [Phycisphaerae bacterium]|nr:SDR family oxidoreductase [Phycisphaerae bacterium]
MKVLITGGAGFIGSHLVEGLMRRGFPVRVLDNFSTGKPANLAALRDESGSAIFDSEGEPLPGKSAELIRGDASDPAVCHASCSGVEIVLHLAAAPSVPLSVSDPAASHRANIEATFRLLLAARDANVRRFIFGASSAAYGDSEQLPKSELMRSLPLSPYAVQKLAGEDYSRAFAKCYGLQTLSMRYFNVFGPRQDPQSQYAAAIPALITAILRDESPTIYGDGEQTRDFTYIENIVAANLLAIQSQETRGELINIACGESFSLNQIIDQINEALGKSVRPQYVPPRPGDIKHSWAAISRAEQVIGYSPIIPFAEGLQRTIEWYRANL